MCVCVYTFIGGSIRSLVFWKMLYAERNWQNMRPERYTHTHTHTHTHTRAFTHTHTCFHTHTRAHMYIHAHPHIPTCAFTRTYIHMLSHTYTHVLSHTHAYIHVLSHTCAFTHTYCAYIAVCSATQSCPTLMTEGLNPARLLCPWDFSGKKAGMGH